MNVSYIYNPLYYVNTHTHIHITYYTHTHTQISTLFAAYNHIRRQIILPLISTRQMKQHGMFKCFVQGPTKTQEVGLKVKSPG